MRISRTFCFPALAFVCLVPAVVEAQLRQNMLPEKYVHVVAPGVPRKKMTKPLPRPGDTGIREIIADKYKKRYEAWKTEFLSSDTGRKEWDGYERSDHFLLTITISDANSRGGGTSKYKWDESGELVAATITLGGKIYEGYPSPIYYPVMNSLAPGNSS